MTRSTEIACPKPVAEPRILIFAPHTRIVAHRSGIHRVALALIEHLARRARVDLVKWDELEGQLRYCDRSDLQRYFRGTPPRGLCVHPLAHRIDYRFAETIAAHEPVVVLMPEVFYLTENGNEIHARVIAQCIADGWTTAAIFYDLIPLKLPGYQERDAFARGLAELARVDVVMPISHYSAGELRAFWKAARNDSVLEASGQRIIAVPLADRDKTLEPPARIGRKRDKVVLLGTIEPRKQQLRVIRAFLKLGLADRAGLHLVVIGGLNPRCEVEFRTLIDRHRDITWLKNATDDDIDAIFACARFSVFASNEEGFGLPIVESLARDVPCLTADRGAMAEAAAGGGCLLVDVDDDSAIEAGLRRLALDDGAIGRLHDEIRDRAWRSWDDHAADVLAAVASYERPCERARMLAEEVAPALVRRLSADARRRPSVLKFDRLQVDIVDTASQSIAAPRDGALHVVLLAPSVEPSRLSERAFAALARADAWFCRSRSAYEAVVARASEGAGPTAPALLSGRCGWRAEPEPFIAMVCSHVAALIERRIRYSRTADRDGVYRAAWRRLVAPGEAPRLTLVVTAYNGAAFIERNVAHLVELVAPLGARVGLVVVDNASTDDTAKRLERFVARREIEYIRLPSNVGLLGNLHAISTLVRARHVWTIGVDDIVVPGAIERVLAVLERDPACPFILPNFSVYHREGFSAGDTCASLLAESRPVGIGCGPDASTTVRDAASRHDNLLTAIYIIIVRSDLMAAIFNSPFTAPFFGSLMDTVPTTKRILEAFPDLAAVWLGEPVIAGNAHNTWRHHRVAWHGVLMPLVFELAREAGLDGTRLRGWARQHVELLQEAEGLYPNTCVADRFPEDALEASFRVFGARLLRKAA